MSVGVSPTLDERLLGGMMGPIGGGGGSVGGASGLSDELGVQSTDGLGSDYGGRIMGPIDGGGGIGDSVGGDEFKNAAQQNVVRSVCTLWAHLYLFFIH